MAPGEKFVEPADDRLWKPCALMQAGYLETAPVPAIHYLGHHYEGNMSWRQRDMRTDELTPALRAKMLAASRNRQAKCGLPPTWHVMERREGRSS